MAHMARDRILLQHPGAVSHDILDPVEHSLLHHPGSASCGTVIGRKTGPDRHWIDLQLLSHRPEGPHPVVLRIIFLDLGVELVLPSLPRVDAARVLGLLKLLADSLDECTLCIYMQFKTSR